MIPSGARAVARWLIPPALMAMGCNSPFEAGSTVSDVRILAVQGNPVFAHPGEQVMVQSLAVDPLGRNLTYAWTTCVDPEGTIATDCLNQVANDARAGHPPNIATGPGLANYSFGIPQDALTGLSPTAAANAMVGVITVVCPGTISFGDPATWNPEVLPITCTDVSGVMLGPDHFVVSVKRIYVRHTDRNQNPAIAEIHWNGAPWSAGDMRAIAPCNADPTVYSDCKGGDRPTVAVIAAPDAVESGTDENGVPFTEQIIAQFYGTETLFEDDVRANDSETHLAARHAAYGRTQTLWFVLRDDRGGVSWTSRTVLVQ
jgi:hypothetical protein